MKRAEHGDAVCDTTSSTSVRITGGRARRRDVRVGAIDIRIQCLCVDSTDPKKIASFWEAALGWRRTFEEDDQVCLEPPDGSPEDGIVPDLLFSRVPEGN